MLNPIYTAIDEAITADPYRGAAATITLKTERMINRARNTDQLDAEDSLTYHFRLALDNDYDLYRERCEVVRDHLAARDTCPVCGGASGVALEEIPGGHCTYCDGEMTVKRHPNQLGERLKDWAEMLVGLGEDPASDRGEGADILRGEMLSTALAWVDWDSVASAYIAEQSE